MIHTLFRSIDDADKQQILFILQKQIKSYLGETSTSISVSESNELLKSILFTFQATGCQQFTQENFSKCQKIIRNLGQSILAQKESFMQTVIPIHSLAYQQSIQSIYTELPNYPFEFFAHEIVGQIDYPLALPIDDTQISGIRYIEQYISRLTFENKFCQAFSFNDIQHLLVAYQAKSQIPYSEDLLNLFEILFDQTFSVFLANLPVKQAFYITSDLQEEIRQILLRAPLAQNFLKQKLIDFLALLSLDAQTSYYFSYLEKYQQKLSSEQQLQPSSLSFLIITEINNQKNEQWLEGSRIPDSLFEQTIERLPFLDTKEKYEWISYNQLTLFDLLEIFESEWILPDELPEFFNYCSNEWIAAFIFYTLKDQREQTFQSFEQQPDFQEVWEQLLHEVFVTSFDNKRKEQIKQIYLTILA